MTQFLPDLPVEGILECLRRSPGHEIRKGKFENPESSARLVANAFGWFLNRARQLPMLQGVPAGHASSVTLEAEMRFPWSGGRHPFLDVAIETQTTLVGVRAVRYEPFRPLKRTGFAEIVDLPVWREKLPRYTQLRDELVEGHENYNTLDGVQLVKDAYALSTRAEKRATGAVLLYLYAEPKQWASGKPVDVARRDLHRREVAAFAKQIAGDGVVFVSLRWRDLLAQWDSVAELKPHVAGLREMFPDLG